MKSLTVKLQFLKKSLRGLLLQTALKQITDIIFNIKKAYMRICFVFFVSSHSLGKLADGGIWLVPKQIIDKNTEK